jgi:hypothetical protein
MRETNAETLWNDNQRLLRQAQDLVEQLQHRADPTFRYGHAVGPHLRHIMEHYTALLQALAQADPVVHYDARGRDMRVQNEPAAALTMLREVLAHWSDLARERSSSHALGQTLGTCLHAGAVGEHSVSVPSTLGRELLFLSSHTVHHFALLAPYCRAAGVEPGPDFGKAPATRAFERLAAA